MLDGSEITLPNFADSRDDLSSTYEFQTTSLDVTETSLINIYSFSYIVKLVDFDNQVTGNF
jgi:hypothetical protein